MPFRRLALALAIAIISGAAASRGRAAPIPARDATLSVWRAGAWRPFWTGDRAPERWLAPDTALVGALAWRRIAPGLEWTSVRIACEAPTWRSRLVVVRLDPRLLSLRLQLDLDPGGQRPAWTIDRAPKDALLAVNAGQFGLALPWGWVVVDGRQLLRPGAGPLASAVAIDRQGGVRWAHGDTLATSGEVACGFQSYPTLLAGGGVVPPPLRPGAAGVSQTHHDARLALGETRERRLLLVMTRFDAVGEAAGVVPLGPTTPEMAAILGALGACDAVMLDGGISAQMLLRDPSARSPLRWRGLRKVPLALIVRARGR